MANFGAASQPGDGTSDAQQLQTANHAGAQQTSPKSKGMPTERITKTHRAESSGLWGWGLPSNKAGAEAGGSMESRACSPPQGRIKELLWRSRLCSGSCLAPCEQRVKSYLCWSIKAGRQQSAINREYKLSTDKALILLL